MTANSYSSLPPVHVHNPDGHSRIVLICEHASSHIPPEYNNLGLAQADLHSHAAWDPGAMSVALQVSDWLDAKLIAGSISRLVYDCNRPPDAPSAMPSQSERITVPGNERLSAAERQRRADAIYVPFHAQVRRAIASTSHPIIVTLHSFTPVFHGAPRKVEIGILHDTDTLLADEMLRVAPAHTTLNAQRNVPYGPEDGVTHTLQLHGIQRGLPNVMIEIRNDLISNPSDQTRMARMLHCWLTDACRSLAHREACA